MKTLPLSLLLFLLAGGVFAQAPPPRVPFHIGAFFFAPEFDTDPDTLRLHYVNGVNTDPTPTLEQREHFLRPDQYNFARQLGLNMVSFTVHPDFVMTDAPERNAVHQVCDAGVPVPPSTEATLNVAVLDLGLTNRLAGERIMFHPELEFTAASPPEPEVQPDFAQRGNFQRVKHTPFNNLPEVDMRLSSSVVLANPSANAVRMVAGQGEIS